MFDRKHKPTDHIAMSDARSRNALDAAELDRRGFRAAAAAKRTRDLCGMNAPLYYGGLH